MGLYGGLTIETTLDPKMQPFLYDHQIDGTPVLPGVMGIEAFAEAALSLLSRLARGSDRGRELPRAVQVLSQRAAHGDRSRRSSSATATRLIADCRLIGRAALPNQAEPQVTTHFTARVRLAEGTAPAVPDRSRHARGNRPVHRSGHLSRLLPRTCLPGDASRRGGMANEWSADGRQPARQSPSTRTSRR